MLGGAAAVVAALLGGEARRMTGLSILTVLGLVPLVGALVIALLPRGSDAVAKLVALATSLVVLVLTIGMCAAFDPAGERFQFVEQHDWIRAFGVQYAVGVDGIALVLIALVAVLVPVVLLASWTDADTPAAPCRAPSRRRRVPPARAAPTARRSPAASAPRAATAGPSRCSRARTATTPTAGRSPVRTPPRRPAAASRRSSRCCSCSRR